MRLNKNIHSFLTKTFSSLLIIVILLCIFGAFARTVINLSKLYSDKNTYLFKSKTEVERTFFKSSLELAEYFKNKPRSDVFLVADEGIAFHYLRYKIYPTRVFKSNEVIYGKPQYPDQFDYYIFSNINDVMKYKKTLVNFVMDKKIQGEEPFFIYKKNEHN